MILPQLLCGWLITSCNHRGQHKEPSRVVRRQGWSWAEQRRDNKDNSGDILLGQFVSNPVQQSTSDHPSQLSNNVLRGHFIETGDTQDQGVQEEDLHEGVPYHPHGDEEYEELYLVDDNTVSYQEYSVPGDLLFLACAC